MRLFNRLIKDQVFAMSIIILMGTVSCNGRHERTDTDTAEKGVIHISVDESFKPVIDSQIQVFEALHPAA